MRRWKQWWMRRWKRWWMRRWKQWWMWRRDRARFNLTWRTSFFDKKIQESLQAFQGVAQKQRNFTWMCAGKVQQENRFAPWFEKSVVESAEISREIPEAVWLCDQNTAKQKHQKAWIVVCSRHKSAARVGNVANTFKSRYWRTVEILLNTHNCGSSHKSHFVGGCQRKWEFVQTTPPSHDIKIRNPSKSAPYKSLLVFKQSYFVGFPILLESNKKCCSKLRRVNDAKTFQRSTRKRAGSREISRTRF